MARVQSVQVGLHSGTDPPHLGHSLSMLVSPSGCLLTPGLWTARSVLSHSWPKAPQFQLARSSTLYYLEHKGLLSHMVLRKAETSAGLSMYFISSLLFHLFITSLLFLGAEVLVDCVRPHVQGSYITCQTPCKMKTPDWAGVGKVNVPFPRAHSREPIPEGWQPSCWYTRANSVSEWLGKKLHQIGTLSLRPKGSFLESHPQMRWGGHTQPWNPQCLHLCPGPHQVWRELADHNTGRGRWEGLWHQGT